jgi:electron transport complex protein RnfA
MVKLLLLIIGAMLVNNFVLTRFLGICPFLGVSRRTETALGMGMAVISFRRHLDHPTGRIDALWH